LLFALAFSHAIALKFQSTPMARVAQLISQVHARIEADGKKEQMSYDKYACWCENTMGRKANDISAAKEQAKSLQTKIIKLAGDLGAHGAEIKQLEKDIQANLESQGEARSVRDGDKTGYLGERSESEQCIGALEAAVKVLTGAGTKTAFLDTLKEAELLSVVVGVRNVVRRPTATQSVSEKDLELIHGFLEHPVDYVGRRGRGLLSAAQVANNPFGDYAPQSTQITGILKGMYDAFIAGLEKANAEEANAQKAFEALMETKRRELETLQDTLEAQQGDNAKKSLDKATSNELLDDTKGQLAADEEFFDTTKASCKEKARQWSIRTGLRTEELSGMTRAVNILSSSDARKIFQRSTTTFIQVGSKGRSSKRRTAVSQLGSLSQRFHSLNLAKLALQVQSGGHFDQVIASIDGMIASLRKEEQDDIEHRDRCQNAEGKNANDMEDLNHAISKAGESLDRLNNRAGDLDAKITVLEGEIKDTKDEMQGALNLRNAAVAEFTQALQDDSMAYALLGQSIIMLQSFYKKNRISASLVQRGDPEYTIDPDKAPATTWADEKYGGRNDETNGIFAIIEMLKEDIQKEMKVSREDNDKNEKQYEKEKAAQQGTLDAQLTLKAATERELGDVQDRVSDTSEFKDAKGRDLTAETKVQGAIGNDCAWVATNFDSRGTKRKAEIGGLNDAKAYLAGAEDDNI